MPSEETKQIVCIMSKVRFKNEFPNVSQKYLAEN